jgi:hypothetical protein
MAGAEPPSVACPIPILIIDGANRKRVDPETALTVHGIYRDIWERKPPTHEEIDFAERRPRDQIDHTEIFDMMLHSDLALGNRLPEKLLRMVESGERPVDNLELKERAIKELRRIEAEKEEKQAKESGQGEGELKSGRETGDGRRRRKGQYTPKTEDTG